MTGMSRTTGRALTTDEHIGQSITDILTTPLGSRVERRDYGSITPDLIDQPLNPANILRLQAGSLMALLKWEPRVSISGTGITLSDAGAVIFDLYGERTDGPRSGTPINLAIPLK